MTSSTNSKLADTAKDAVEDLAETAKSKATLKAETTKAQIADRVADEADSFRAASSAFQDNALASNAVQYLGDNLAHAASAVREMDLSNIQHDMTQFARRNPLVFFGGAAALGFLAARALKASERAGVQATQPDRHNYPGVPEHQTAYSDQNARRWGYS